MDEIIYQKFLDSSHERFVRGVSDSIISRYSHEICHILARYLHVQIYGNAIIRILYPGGRFIVYCLSWCKEHVPADADIRVNIKSTRRAILGRLVGIVENYDACIIAITGILPQPLSEEIIPQVYMIGEVIDAFL
jgi:hypothetical protein